MGKFKKNFDKKIRKLESTKKDLPLQLANIAKRHFVQSFKDGGFRDVNLSPWAKRKANSRRNKGRALLVDTGAMRRSVKVIKASFDIIKVGSVGVSYAKYHNDPKKARVHRQFIGKSKALRQKHLRKINIEFNKSMQ